MSEFPNGENMHPDRVAAITRRNPKQWLIAIQSVRFAPSPTFQLEDVFGEKADLDTMTRDALLLLPDDYLHNQTLGGLLVDHMPGNAHTLAGHLFAALRREGVPETIVSPMEEHIALLLKYDNTSIGHLLGLHDPLERQLEHALHNIRKTRRFMPNNDNLGAGRSIPGESRNPLNPRIGFPGKAAADSAPW